MARPLTGGHWAHGPTQVSWRFRRNAPFSPRSRRRWQRGSGQGRPEPCLRTSWPFLLEWLRQLPLAPEAAGPKGLPADGDVPWEHATWLSASRASRDGSRRAPFTRLDGSSSPLRTARAQGPEARRDNPQSSPLGARQQDEAEGARAQAAVELPYLPAPVPGCYLRVVHLQGLGSEPRVDVQPEHLQLTSGGLRHCLRL